MIQDTQLPSLTVAGSNGWSESQIWHYLDPAAMDDEEKKEHRWACQLPDEVIRTFVATVDLMIKASVPHRDIARLGDRWNELPFRHISFKKNYDLRYQVCSTINDGLDMSIEECLLQDFQKAVASYSEVAIDDAVARELARFFSALNGCAVCTLLNMMPQFCGYLVQIPDHVREHLCNHLYRIIVMELLSQVS